MKTYIYRSTFSEGLTDYFRKQLEPEQYAIFEMLFHSYRFAQKLKSAFFELCRVGDGKYTLTVQKYANDTFSVKFTINIDYANKLERFCGYERKK